jgi:hypothetical protein
MNHVFHTVYGLRVRADRPIPGLALENDPGAFDMDVHLQRGTWPLDGDATQRAVRVIGEWTDENGDAGWRMHSMDDGGVRILYADGTDFLIDAAGREVWATWRAPLTLDDTATYLLGPILRRVLALHGVLCLHGSAIVLDGQAVALVGPAGAGKSTAAAAFAARGVPVLSDDLVALTPEADGFLVQPGYRLVRLWPDVAQTVCGDELPRLTPNWDKRFLALDGRRFAGRAVRLAAIYLLDDAQSGDSAPAVAPMTARQALMGLITNSRSAYGIDRSSLATEYELVACLRQAVRVRRLVPHASLGYLQQLCDVIERDFAEQTSGPSDMTPAIATGAAR